MGCGEGSGLDRAAYHKNAIQTAGKYLGIL